MVKHIEWLDKVRGGAIFLVVLGHMTFIDNTPNWYNVIHFMLSLFHMPLFFAMSGFLFGLKFAPQNRLYMIIKKLVSLGIPYILFSEVYIIFLLGVQEYIQTNTKVSMIDCIRILWKPVGHYWFLQTLLIYFVLTIWLYKYKTLFWIAGCLSIFGYLIVYIWTGGGIKTMISFLFPFFASIQVGKLYKRKVISEKLLLRKFEKYGYIALILFLIDSLAVYSHTAIKDIYIIGAFNGLLLVMLGIIAYGYICIQLSRVSFFGRLLEILGKKSWYIYLLHTYFLAAVRFVLRKYGIYDTSLQLIFAILFACGIPIIISYMTEKVKALDWCFYPQKYFKYLNK